MCIPMCDINVTYVSRLYRERRVGDKPARATSNGAKTTARVVAGRVVSWLRAPAGLLSQHRGFFVTSFWITLSISSRNRSLAPFFFLFFGLPLLYCSHSPAMYFERRVRFVDLSKTNFRYTIVLTSGGRKIFWLWSKDIGGASTSRCIVATRENAERGQEV